MIYNHLRHEKEMLHALSHTWDMRGVRHCASIPAELECCCSIHKIQQQVEICAATHPRHAEQKYASHTTRQSMGFVALLLNFGQTAIQLCRLCFLAGLLAPSAAAAASGNGQVGFHAVSKLVLPAQQQHTQRMQPVLSEKAVSPGVNNRKSQY